MRRILIANRGEVALRITRTAADLGIETVCVFASEDEAAPYLAAATIATRLPVGPPPGVVPKKLRAIPPLSGPMGPFAGIAINATGTLYISGDAEGSILVLRRE